MALFILGVFIVRSSDSSAFEVNWVTELDPLTDRWNLDVAIRESLRMFDEPAQHGVRTWHVTFTSARFEFSVRLQQFGCTFVLTCERIDKPCSPTYWFVQVGDESDACISDALRDRLARIVCDEAERDAE